MLVENFDKSTTTPAASWPTQSATGSSDQDHQHDHEDDGDRLQLYGHHNNLYQNEIIPRMENADNRWRDDANNGEWWR